MARQSGPIFIEGTLDDLTFYKMQGEYYVRMKSRLTRKRVLESPRFALTRLHANQLAEASRIASLIYMQIPKEEKGIKLFRTIVGKAKVMLMEGKEKEEVLAELRPMKSERAMVKSERLKQKKFSRKVGKVSKAAEVKEGVNIKSSSRIPFPKTDSLRLTRGKLIIKDSSNASHFLSSFGMTKRELQGMTNEREYVADP